jgi:hypothetical protein
MYTYEELRADRSLSPYQGPDKLGKKTLPIVREVGGRVGWKPFELLPWKPEHKATKAATQHIDMSQRVFTSLEGYKFTFWALAPIQPGTRSKWQNNMHCEFVWMILDGTNGRGVHIGLVDPETSEVRWWREMADYFVSGCQEVAAS